MSPTHTNMFFEGDTLLSARDAAALDLAVTAFMGANQIPNGALAVLSSLRTQLGGIGFAGWGGRSDTLV